MFVYVVALLFNFHNVIVYLIMQRRIKTWLISTFYAVSQIVLFSRIVFYCFSIAYFKHLNAGSIDESTEATWQSRIVVTRTVALYSKIALGFFQLALVLELSLLLTKNVKLKQEVEKMIEFRQRNEGEYGGSILVQHDLPSLTVPGLIDEAGGRLTIRNMSIESNKIALNTFDSDSMKPLDTGNFT